MRLEAVSHSYEDKQPFWITGTIHTVKFDFGDGVELTPEERFEQFLKLD